MSEILAEHADFLFDEVQKTVSNIPEEELNWNPIEESNSIHGNLNHTERIAYILIPQVIDGTVNPKGGDDDYENTLHSYDALLRDLGKAREKVVGGIKEMSKKDLEDTIKLWGRDLVRKHLLFHIIREVVHHNGQIAMLKGMYKWSHA
jgi:uncharacterized damage-inducible protein DinB